MIYVPSQLDGYELCHPVRQDDFETINAEINGESRQSSWKPVPMRLIREDKGRKLTSSDSPWLGAHALIFRANVESALGPLLRENGELLPLACQEADLTIFNPTRVIDALDEEASSVVRFSGGRIMMIRRHVFHPEVIRDIDVFKIPNLRVSPTFVSHRFVDRWKMSGLKGLEFRQLWAPPD
jgi:hypothetical protein